MATGGKDTIERTARDPACATRCGARHLSDISYNSSTGFWSCCTYDSNGKANCDEPSSEIWPGPAPDNLVEIQYLPEEGTPEYAVAEAQNSSMSNTKSNTPESLSSSVNIGAAVGGGVGAGLGFFLILIAVFFLVQRSRSRKAAVRQSLDNLSLKEEQEQERPWLQPRSQSQPQPQTFFRGGELAADVQGTRSHPEELEGDYAGRF
ncbi:hypothetical protein BJX70DRAFT_394729 [Aspergillus crustosus]